MAPPPGTDAHNSETLEPLHEELQTCSSHGRSKYSTDKSSQEKNNAEFYQLAKT
jgi:hypothetical protein